MQNHANARLTRSDRLRLVRQHLEHGRSLAQITAESGISLHCASPCLARYHRVGDRITGNRQQGRAYGVGYDKVPFAVDDDTRLTNVCRSFAKVCSTMGLRHIHTRPHTPRTNGKGERFIHTLCREQADAMPFQESEERNRWLPNPWRSIPGSGSTRPSDAALLSSSSTSRCADEPAETQHSGLLIETLHAHQEKRQGPTELRQRHGVARHRGREGPRQATQPYLKS
jgi:hypothetical protein